MQAAARRWRRRLLPGGGTLAACCLFVAGVRAADPQSLVEQAEAARFRSPVEARALNRQARALLATQPDPRLEARSYLSDCASLIEADSRRGAAAAGRGIAALSRLPAPGDPVLRARLELCNLNAREYLGEIKEALPAYHHLVDEAVRLGDARLQAEAYHARGDLLGYVGRFAEGLDDIQLSCRIYRKLGLQDQAWVCQQSLAIIYYRFGDYDRAAEFIGEVVQARRERGQTYMLADALFNLARSLEGKGDFDGALARYEEMLGMSRQLANPTGEAYGQQAMGALLIKRQQPQRALELLDGALAAFRAQDDTDMVARLQGLRGEALTQLQRYPQAIAALEESVRLYEVLEQQPGLESTYGLLADALLRTGAHARAAATLLAQRTVHEALDRERRDETLARQRAQFESEKREQVNRRLEAQRALADANLQNALRVDRLKTVVIVLSVLLLSAVGVFLLRQLRLSARLRALALADELTGIGNRRSVLAFLEQQIRQHRASGRPLAVAILDLDRFKQLNDQYGHAAGDEALKAVANLCQHMMRGNDKIGRTGGEEFLAVLPDATLAHAGEVAERLCEQVRRLELDHVARGLRITASIGVSEWLPGDADAHAVVKRADVALYQAKAEGRDCVRLAGA
jgi:diguanylate cyclase (GGDEF)-like protein